MNTLAWFCTRLLLVISMSNHVVCSHLPSSCLEVSTYRPNGPDGEYWLDLFKNNTKYRVYCHKLNSGNPQEFLSLKYPENNFAYSEKDRVDNINAEVGICSHNNDRLLFNGGGQTVYHKVRLQVAPGNLTIDIHDATFSVTDADSFVDHVPYASPESCYDFGQPGKGRFSVDLRGTGITISPRTAWIADGYASQMKDYQEQFDGQVVTATCGGWPGRCLPDPDFYIELHPADVIEEESAESVVTPEEFTTSVVKFHLPSHLPDHVETTLDYLSCARTCVTMVTCLSFDGATGNYQTQASGTEYPVKKLSLGNY